MGNRQQTVMLHLLIAFSIAVASVYGQVNRCPVGWVPYKNNCYYFSNTPRTFDGAKLTCSDRQAALVSVTSKDEANFIATQCKQLRRTYWLGLTDSAQEGNWKWLDPKSKFAWKQLPWNKNEPNGKTRENCATMLSNGKVNDLNCRAGVQAICKRNLYVADVCDIGNDWHPLGKNCYKYFDIPRTWQDAKDDCQSQNGDLLTVNDASETRFIQDSITCKESRMNAWIGLSDTNDKVNFKWNSDNSVLNNALAQWDKGMPKKSSAAGDNCVVVLADNNYKWSTEACSGEHKYVCERAQGRCPRGWRSWYGRCYQVNSGRNMMSWTDAVKKCSQQGASLMTLDLPQEINYAKRTLFPALRTARISSVWIGISDQVTDGKFLKADKTAVVSPNWDKNQPVNIKNRMDCARVATSSKTAKYATDNCFFKRAFVCEMPIHVQISPPPTPTPSRYSCDRGWKLFDSHCYLFNTADTTWDDAKNKCAAQQAALASITSADEQSFISANVRSLTWIGLNDQKVDSKFVWVDGTPNPAGSFVNWNRNEPNGGKNEQCVVVWGQGGIVGAWVDLPCNQRRDYVCKKKAIDGALPTTPIPTTRPWSPLCGPYWLYDPTNNNCYYMSDDYQTWAASQNECRKKGGDLLSINTPHEQSFMTALLLTGVTSGGNFWIGGNDRSAEGGWSWSDGSPFRYLNWNSGEPNGYNGGEDCVEISPSRQGQWNDAKCNSKYRYICEKATNAPTTTIDPLGTPATPIDCDPHPMISGIHTIPNDALTASSSWDRNHSPTNSRLGATRSDWRSTVDTPNAYKYFQINNADISGATFVRLQIKACNDAHIKLTPTTDASQANDKNAYEVVIGGWGNGQSAIRKDAQSKPMVQVNTPKILDCKSFRKFWISWNGAVIQVGSGDRVNFNPIMKWSDPKPYAVGGIAVSTGFGATGSWKVFIPGVKSGSWSSKLNKVGEYIQADFTVPIAVKGIITQGRQDLGQWVLTYKIQYRYDSSSKWAMYQDPPGKVKVFKANSDQNTKVTNPLTFPFEARFVRLLPQTWKDHISLRWEVLGCIADSECKGEYLVSGDIRAPDSAIVSTGNFDGNHAAKAARLDQAGGWVSGAISTDEFIQVDLGQDYRIRGIVTQGRADAPQWTISYKVAYKRDGSPNLLYYQEPYSQVKSFIANSDQNSKVTNMFASPFRARYVRLNPQTYQTHIALRFDVIGCMIGCEAVPLINGAHRVADSQLRASSQSSAAFNPSRSRLNTKVQGSRRAAWRPKTYKAGQWIQVDLQTNMYIRAIATQGRGDYDAWVTNYFLTYSNDRKKWYSYQEAGKRKILDGNSDRNTIRKNVLKKPFTARWIRLFPTKYSKQMALRWEVYGCESPESSYATSYVGCFEDNKNSRDLPFAPWKPSWSMWIQMCVRHCYHYGYMYAGLQGGSYCFCGNSYGSHGPSGRCNKPCTGNANTTCGGAFASSIYSTGIGPRSLRCDDGWTTSGDNCYKVMNDRSRTWRESRDNCRSVGGDLASVNTAVEQSALVSALQSLKGSPWTGVWIGLNDLDHQMFFSWSDGSNVALTKWNKNEPNNFGQGFEDCVLIFKGNGLWNDESCEKKLPSVCEKPKQVLPPATVPPNKWGCDPGWLPYTYSCYLFSSAYPRTWTQARSFCRQMGAQLVRVSSVYEQSFLTSQLGDKKGSYWTDLTDNIIKGVYSWSDKNTAAILYTNWDQKQPDDTQGKCVIMKTGRRAGLWNDVACSNKNNLVCEKLRKGFTSPPPPTHPATVPPCAAGWVAWGDNCFQFNAPTNSVLRKSWVDARQDCVNQGADLASFHNDTEFYALYRSSLQGSASFWIGLSQRDTDKGYQWSDGSAVVYTNWAQNQPDNHQNREDCVEVWTNSGQWNDNNCGNRQNWVCRIAAVKTPKSIVTTAAPTAGPSGSCSPDDDTWKFFNGKCYMLNDGKQGDGKTWREANKYCMSMGGYLASILSQDTQNFLLGQALQLDVGSLWIGLNELSVSSGHRWVDGQPATYFNWANGEPNDFGGGESCGEMWVGSQGQWNDAHCSDVKGFICEKFKGQRPITQPTPPSVVRGFCPPGYLAYGNKCFRIFGEADDRRNWTAARDTCAANGDTLASILSNDENAFLTSNFMGLTDSLWIGLNKYRNSWRYTWVSEDEVTYTNWDQGEPNGAPAWDKKRKQEPCVEILTSQGNHHAGHWNDLPCDWWKGYICMRPRDVNLLTPAPTVNPCDPGWKPLGKTCYLFSTGSSSWDVAKSHCEQQGATLTSITSEVEQAFLYTWLKSTSQQQPVWIGLSDKTSPGSYTWVNQWPVIYTNWDTNEPSTGTADEGCVSYDVSTGLWKDGACGQMLSSICQKIPADVKPPFTQIPPTDGQCPQVDNEFWIPSNGFCYLFKVDDQVSFAEASLACNSRFGEIASVHSKAETDFIVNHWSSQTWRSSWIGLMRNSKGAFFWKDGTAVQYTNWAPKEPNDFGDNPENCVELYSKGDWNDNNCAAKMGYICKAKMSYGADVSTPPDVGQPNAVTSSYSSVSAKSTTTTASQPGGNNRRTRSKNGYSTPGALTQSDSTNVGAIVGVIVGVAVIIIIVTGVVIFYRKIYSRKNLDVGFDNALYTSSQDTVKVQSSVDFDSTNNGYDNPAVQTDA